MLEMSKDLIYLTERLYNLGNVARIEKRKKFKIRRPPTIARMGNIEDQLLKKAYYSFLINGKFWVYETGFFQHGRHIDKNIFSKSSLNMDGIDKIIYKYYYPADATELYNKNLLTQKYFQKPDTIENWDGFVLIAQRPIDYSILDAGTPKDYFDFFESQCKYFGKRLFIKKHPREISRGKIHQTTSGMSETYDRFIRRMCKKYKCQSGHVNTSIIDNAEGIISYNSTFCVDAALRGKHVMQYAPGYFYKSGLVQYTDRKLCSVSVNIDEDYKKTFLNFLLWKYCFHEAQPVNWTRNIFYTYADSSETFPLPMEYSYGAYVLKTMKQEISNQKESQLELNF